MSIIPTLIQKGFFIYVKLFLILTGIYLVEMKFLPRLIITFLFLIPYIKFTKIQFLEFFREKKYIKNNSFILFNSDNYDQIQRQKVNKKGIKLILNFVTILILILGFVFPFIMTEKGITIYQRNLPLVIEIFAVFYFSYRMFSYLYIRLTNKFSLVAILIFSNPIFSLTLFLAVLNPISEKVNKKMLFLNHADGGVYVFLEMGLQPGFVIMSLLYSIIFQISYSVIQPIYKLEKSRFALEIVTTISGITSLVGLIYSKELSHFLFDYIYNNPILKQEYIPYVEKYSSDKLDTVEGFTSFFEKTFKLVLLPFTVCSSVALLIFKHREIEAKRKANKYFQSLLINTTLYSNEEKVGILQKAIYYGGGNIKNIIVSNRMLNRLVLNYLIDHSKYRNKFLKTIIILTRFYRIKFKHIFYFTKAFSHVNWIKAKIEFFLTKEEFIYFNRSFKEYSILKKIKSFLRITVGVCLLFIWFYLVFSGKLFYFYSKYLNVFNDNVSNLILLVSVFMTVIYSLFLHVTNKNKQEELERTIKRKQSIRLIVGLIVLIAISTIYIIYYTMNIDLSFMIKGSSFYMLWFIIQSQMDKHNKK